MDNYIVYKNFSEFQADFPEVAAELFEYADEGTWQTSELYYFPSLEDYAEYELTEGWYIDLNLDDFDFRGAPNPLDYIDLHKFGEALWDRCDSSTTWSNGDVVVVTEFGW